MDDLVEKSLQDSAELEVDEHSGAWAVRMAFIGFFGGLSIAPFCIASLVASQTDLV